MTPGAKSGPGPSRPTGTRPGFTTTTSRAPAARGCGTIWPSGRLRRAPPPASAWGRLPEQWDALTRALTAKGYSKMELIDAGLAVAGKNGGVYDKFRARLMLPVIDVRGEVAGFTSRILPGEEGAKYLNTPETIAFKKGRLI